MIWFFSMLVGIIIGVYVSIAKKKNIKANSQKIDDGDYRIVFVINKDLKMSTGKILSQFGHAMDGIYREMEKYPALVDAWKRNGSAKIVLKGTSEDIRNTEKLAIENKIPYVSVYDAGRTQIKPGSNTCISIGPAKKENLHPITGKLPLY